MINKLKQQCGETLVEALVSLLIAVLSMGVLSSSVIAASNINQKTRELDSEYAEKLYNAEGMVEVNEQTAVLHIDFYDDTFTDAEVDITLYGGEDNDFVSYEEYVEPESEDTP